MGSMIGQIFHRRNDAGTPPCEALFVCVDDPSNPDVIPSAATMNLDFRGNGGFIGEPYSDVARDVMVDQDGFQTAAGTPGTWHGFNECPDR